MARSFWVGAGAGMLVTAGVTLLMLLQRGDQGVRGGLQDDGGVSARLQEELAAVREELVRAKADVARAQADGQARADSREAMESGAERGSSATPPRPDDGPQAEWAQLLARGDFQGAAAVLAVAFERGDLTKLELMQLAVAEPELIVAGVNDHALPDDFRSALIDGLSSLDDPLHTVARLDLEHEPNQRFSARIAAFLAQSVERAASADGRTVAAIEQLLAGNEMQGEKVNLYPVLAQLGALGDEAALALLQDVDPGVFGAGLRTLLDPPARDERGEALRGALVYSVQYNKGQWESRPRQLLSGDIVVSIGGERVTSAAGFFALVKQHQALAALAFVEAGVLRPSPSYAGQFEFASLQLDPGDLQLLYGVYTVKRP